MERLKNKSLYLLDMDGTIYFENELIDGAADFLKSLRDNGKDYIFMTNNSIQKKKRILQNMKFRFGIHLNICIKIFRKKFLLSCLQVAFFFQDQHFYVILKQFADAHQRNICVNIEPKKPKNCSKPQQCLKPKLPTHADFMTCLIWKNISEQTEPRFMISRLVVGLFLL